jgi:cytochrome c peroxidase
MAIPEYRQLFAAAYPGVSQASLGFEHAANALAAYQTSAYTTLNSPFDVYLAGNDGALSDDQKRGGILFYSDGGCSACHSGALQTDQAFHNIAVPQIGPGKDASGLDLGRYLETNLAADTFAFKTTSLRNVTLTAPYMHNGSLVTLGEAVQHYQNIEDSLRNFTGVSLLPELRASLKNDPDTLNQILATLDDKAKNLPLEGRTLGLVKFLEALTDPRALDLSDVVPATVPSGLPVGD